jgi:phosphatidate phosphatase APP1
MSHMGTMRSRGGVKGAVFVGIITVFVNTLGCAADTEAEPTDDLSEFDATGKGELAVVSDLDDTVIPKAKVDLSVAPFPGVRALYDVLEHRRKGKDGDVYYVTARTPDRIADVPAYLERHAMPAGAIATGKSTLPWVAQPEKVKDIEAILAKTKKQSFVLFGDSSHRDPEVYKEVIAKHPDRVVAAFIHKVNKTVSPDRVKGLHLVESYAEAAGILYRLGALTKTEARGVMKAARDEGLAITDDEMNALLAK